MMDFDGLRKRTLALREKFKSRFDKRDRVLDLVEEVGELAHAVLRAEGRKQIAASHPRIKEGRDKDIADALSDILFDLIVLAEDYGIDLTEEYAQMLKKLEARIDNGEFEEE